METIIEWNIRPSCIICAETLSEGNGGKLFCEDCGDQVDLIADKKKARAREEAERKKREN